MGSIGFLPTLHFLLQHCNMPGGIAQLGERLNGIQEVSGSIPLISTSPVGRVVKNRGIKFALASFISRREVRF